MAKTKKPAGKKLTREQLRVVLKVTADAASDVPPNCDDLYAAAAAIQQLITEHCPIAATKRAKK
jgi:hypothetical protein